MNEGERGLLPEPSVQWVRVSELGVVAVDIDGRNIFQWRHEYAELVSHFTKYADHTPECSSRDPEHQHLMMHTGASDPRAVCVEAPCTCGLLIMLGVMMHPTKFVYPCPDKPTPIHPSELDVYLEQPSTLYGLPIVESDVLPQGTIEVGGGGGRIQYRLTPIGDNRYIVEDVDMPNLPILGIDTDDPDKV